ncbi:MAG: glycosyltransferase [Gemmatimonadaceae bacterium]
MLYLAIPAHNEAATIGVLLWRLRTVLAEFPREYEAVVYDDASNDSTSEILESYARVMPLTVLRGERKVGYAGAVDALVRHVARHTRYPRRDAMLLLQGDFTDSPSLVPEFVKRFEGGTDVVVGERGNSSRRKAPTPVRRLMRAEPWLLRFFVKAEGIRDLTSSYRLIRISVLRDLLRTVGDAAVCAGDPRTANADFLMRLVPLARRVEGLPVEPTWDVRLRETRVVAMADGMNLLKWAWRSRGRKAVPSTAPEVVSDAPRNSRGGRGDSRLDSTADVAVTVADGGRNGGTRDANNNRTRKARPGRGEGRNENREEKKADGRAESRAENKSPVRSESRNESRNDSRNDSRTESRTDRPENRPEPRREPPLKLVDDESMDETLSVEGAEGSESPARERPPRRKRTRGGRRDRAAAAAEGSEGSEGSESPSTSEPIASNVERPESAADDRDDFDVMRSEVELSPALSEAVADAEAQLDIPGHTRPARKKRRRRGGRGGRAAGSIAGGEDSAASGDEGGGSDSDFDGGSEGEADAGEADARGADAGEAGAGGADAGARGDGGEQAAGEGEGEGEERVRRRGRRGRRGGSRRSRAARGESSSDSEFSGDAGGSDSGGEPTPSNGPAED